MKRRDWKIKKLEKNIFGNLKKKKSRYKKKNIFFLRKLYIRRNRVMFKKNLIINFLFFRKFKNTFFFKLNNLTQLMVKVLPFYLEFLPLFFFKKKVSLSYNIFYSFLQKNNLDYFFIKNQNNLINKNNLKIILFSKIDSLKKLIINDNELNKFLNEKNEDVFICNKKLILSDFLSKELNHSPFFNYFFHFNLYILNSIEFYKILIILYLNKLNK